MDKNKIFNNEEIEILEKFIRLIDPDNKVFNNTNESIDKTKKLVLQLDDEKNEHTKEFRGFSR